MFASSSRVRTRRVVSFVGGDCFTHFVELKSQSITRRSCACRARQFGQNISSIYIDCMENPPAILFRRAQLLTPRLRVYYGGRMFTRRECERAKIPRIGTRSSRVCTSVAFASVCSRRIERPDNRNEVCGHRGSRIPGRMLREGAEERRLRKQCILSESRFDFLKDLVKSLPDVSGPDDEVPTSPETSVPLQINLPNTATACPTVTQHPDPLEYQKQLGLPISVESSTNHKSTRDNGSTAVSSNLNPANQRAVGAHSQVPEFQISVPASFQISQPNFYTEVNPSASNQPTSNFTHTANIDEDYDT